MTSKIERDVDRELQGVDSDTFLYQLHENCFFHEERFHAFLALCQELVSFYVQHGKTPQYTEIVRLLLDRFAYIAGIFAFHYSSMDSFQIQNWSARMESDILPYYFDVYREICSGIIIN